VTSAQPPVHSGHSFRSFSKNETPPGMVASPYGCQELRTRAGTDFERARLVARKRLIVIALPRVADQPPLAPLPERSGSGRARFDRQPCLRQSARSASSGSGLVFRVQLRHRTLRSVSGGGGGRIQTHRIQHAAREFDMPRRPAGVVAVADPDHMAPDPATGLPRAVDPGTGPSVIFQQKDSWLV